MGHSSIDHPIIRAIQFPSSLLSRACIVVSTVLCRVSCSDKCSNLLRVFLVSIQYQALSSPEFFILFVFLWQIRIHGNPIISLFQISAKVVAVIVLSPGVYISTPLRESHEITVSKTRPERILSISHNFSKIVLLTSCISLYLLRKKSLGAVHTCI